MLQYTHAKRKTMVDASMYVRRMVMMPSVVVTMVSNLLLMARLVRRFIHVTNQPREVVIRLVSRLEMNTFVLVKNLSSN